jgi:hypothetical protein
MDLVFEFLTFPKRSTSRDSSGCAPGVKIGVADAAYLRASDAWKDRLYLRQKLPEAECDGSDFECFSVSCNFLSLKRDALNKTHVVQSHRGLIERMFARLKKWEVLFDGVINAADTWEMELDCAMALQNLLEMERLDLLNLIPARPPIAPGSHIITPDLAPSMKWPKPLDWNHANMPLHLKEFYRERCRQWLPSFGKLFYRRQIGSNFLRPL